VNKFNLILDWQDRVKRQPVGRRRGRS
jgi:hypothetical protein